MAGSFRQMTRKDGTPRKNFGHPDYIEYGGDVIETLMECYGMIWWMAQKFLLSEGYTEPTRDQIMEFIQTARASKRDGLDRGKSGR